MGKRSADETVIAIIVALMFQRRWEQAALAREVGVTVDTVRRCLRNLQSRDRRIESANEHPHVVWRVPKDWAPRALPLTFDSARVLVELLARTGGRKRDEILSRVAALLPEPALAARAAGVVVCPDLGEAEERVYSVLVTAAIQQKAVRIRYRSARSAGEAELRDVSPQRITAGSPLYLIATCHREDRLKRFRLDCADEAVIVESVPFRVVAGNEIERYLATSAGAFRGDKVETIEFEIRRAAWGRVRRNLPKRVDDTGLTYAGEWVRVRLETAAVTQWARHVVGLGGDVRLPDGVLREETRRVIAEAVRALEG